MEKKRKTLQIYAILICVVAVITFIINVANLASAMIDRSDPLYSGRSEIELSSFDNFKMNTLSTVQVDQAFIPDDTTIERMYNSAKEDKIRTVMHNSRRNIIVNSLVGIIALLLFFSHWFLIRKVDKE